MKRRLNKSQGISFAFTVVVMCLLAVIVGFIIGNWMLGYVLRPDEDMTTISEEPVVDEEFIAFEDQEEEEEENDFLHPDDIEELVLEDAYLVQLGAFQSRENARNLVAQLHELDYEAFMTEESPYRVQVGGFSSRDQAEEVGQELENLGYEVFISR